MMELEKGLDKQDAIEVLRAIADAIESGTVCSIEIDGRTIELSPNASASIEYEEEGDEAEIELEFSWSLAMEKAASPDQKGLSRKPRFEIFAGKDNQFYFHLKASNGEIILASEGYVSKQGASKGVESVQSNNREDQFEIRRSKIGQPYFVLKAGNGEIIGKSQMYKRKTGCLKGIQSVIKSAAIAEIQASDLNQESQDEKLGEAL